MKIQYLGTAAAEGWPGLFCNCECCTEAKRRGGKNLRTRSQALIEGNLLVDFPPDTYLHMLRDGLDLPSIHTVIVTHSHQDHFYPLDIALRSPIFAHKMSGQLTIYGNDAVKASWESGLSFLETDSAALQEFVKYQEIEPFQPFEAEGCEITALSALHKRSEKCYIYSIRKGDKSLLYANDTGIPPQSTLDYLRGRHFDLVSMDCTMQQIPDGANHMGIRDNIALREILEKNGCVDRNTKYVITHFSHNGGLLHEELVERVADLGFQVAYDGLAVEF